jgi:hypothetical protein
MSFWDVDIIVKVAVRRLTASVACMLWLVMCWVVMWAHATRWRSCPQAYEHAMTSHKSRGASRGPAAPPSAAAAIAADAAVSEAPVVSCLEEVEEAAVNAPSPRKRQRSDGGSDLDADEAAEPGSLDVADGGRRSVAAAKADIPRAVGFAPVHTVTHVVPPRAAAPPSAAVPTAGAAVMATPALSTDPASLWPLPPHLLAAAQASTSPATTSGHALDSVQGAATAARAVRDQVLSDLLNAWYWSGFYAGRFSVLQSP